MQFSVDVPNNTPGYFFLDPRIVFLPYQPFPVPTCIPVMATAGPRQLGGEAVEEVEDGPGENHYIVHV